MEPKIEREYLLFENQFLDCSFVYAFEYGNERNINHKESDYQAAT